MNVEDEKCHAFQKTEADRCVLNPNPMKKKQNKNIIGLWVWFKDNAYILFIFQQKYLKFKWICMQNYSLNKLL